MESGSKIAMFSGRAVYVIGSLHLGTTGAPTTLHDTIFSTIAGAPAYVGKAPRFTMTNTGLGINVDLQNHNAIQGSFLFEG
jgi:hypothetical protein